MGPSATDAERRALAIIERLSGRAAPARLRERLLRREPAEVIHRVEALERSASRAARALPTDLPGERGPPAPPPERVGTFRLESLIGEGGMGQVWRAVRDDGLFDQQVAVKLLHAHLAPLAAGRFDQERRLLARLEHPGIARLIDGGVTEDGTPYLVMEHVDGAPIDAAASGLPLRARVDLFRRAGEAVAFAHSRLVVHADLKPSNILVTDQGWVKLLDFGIARLIDEGPEGEALHPMTRAYASPARLAGAGPAIADDVYALGVILGELIAADGDRDLRAIADKAAAETEAGRYGSAPDLIADLDRWRERLPVTARPATARYRAARFVSRHRRGVAATAGAMLLLSATSVTATLSYLDAERARARATARFDDVRGTARYLLYDLSDKLERLPGSLPLRMEVARESQKYLERLGSSPDAPAAVRLEAAEGLLQLADRQGRPGRPNLGQAEAARASYDLAFAKLSAMRGPEVDRLRAEGLIARSHLEAQTFSDLPAAERALAAAEPLTRGSPLRSEYEAAIAALRVTQGRYPEAITAARAARAAPGSREGYRRQVTELRAIEQEADAVYYAGDEPGSLPLYREAMQRWEAVARRWPGDPLAVRRLPRARYNLGVVLVELTPAQAPALLAQAAEESRALSERDPSDVEAARMHSVILGAHAQALAAVGRRDEAIGVVSRLVEQRRRDWEAQPGQARRLRDYAITVAMLGDIQADSGREPAACRRYAHARALFGRLESFGQQVGVDKDNALRLVLDRQARHCRK